jgi:putative salt-induced outer membrane protein
LAAKIERREQLSFEKFRVQTLIRDGLSASPFSKKRMLLHFKTPTPLSINDLITITRRIMRIARVLAANLVFVALAYGTFADTLVLKNGDHLTGTIESSDTKEITFKTDYAGEIKVQWSAVKETATDKPLYVVKTDKATVNGTVTAEDSNVTVHTANAGDVTVPLSNVAIIRSPDLQQAYENGLHPGLFENWKGGANLGLALARGNSDTTNLAVGFNADRKTNSDEIKMYLSSIYTTTGTPVSATTANEITGGLRYDRNINHTLFGFVSGDYAHNGLQDLDIQQIYTGGLGAHMINHPNTTLDVLGGVNYTRETYSGVTTVGGASTNVQRNLAALTVGENFVKKFGGTSTLNEHFYFYPDLTETGEYRFSLDAGWVTQIKKWLGWQITVSDRYITNPPILGTKDNDVVLSTGFNFSFSH